MADEAYVRAEGQGQEYGANARAARRAAKVAAEKRAEKARAAAEEDGGGNGKPMAIPAEDEE